MLRAKEMMLVRTESGHPPPPPTHVEGSPERRLAAECTALPFNVQGPCRRWQVSHPPTGRVCGGGGGLSGRTGPKGSGAASVLRCVSGPFAPRGECRMQSCAPLEGGRALHRGACGAGPLVRNTMAPDRPVLTIFFDKGGPSPRDAVERGEVPPSPLPGAQPMPCDCLPDGKRQVQWHLKLTVTAPNHLGNLLQPPA